ncbi:MAG: phosphatase PAP2 family protein [Deltaproteobacteria bacterium]|nr:phosphatase PAP2 family protein [Deltaproteobacteria bacterium]
MDTFLDMFHGTTFGSLAQFFSIVGDGITLAGICIFLFVLGIISKKEYVRISGMYGLMALLVSSFFLHLFKIAFERSRPNFSNTDILFFLENPSIFDFTGRFNSFPSGHTTVSFAIAYTLSKSFPRLSPIFYITATMVGLSRIYISSHYPSDVAGGAIIGILVSMFLFSGVKKQWKAGFFFSIAVFLSFFKLGGLLLFDTDEAAYSAATREMLETGNYITPTFNYEPFYDKPILFYWLQAVVFKLFGVGEFSARSVSALFGVGLLAITFFFVKRLYGQRAGILAGMCLLVNLEFFVYTHAAVLDMLLTFFITAALYSFYLGLQQNRPVLERLPQGDNPSHLVSQTPHGNYWYFLSWVFAAMAALTKGVIGILFPAMIIFLYLIAVKELREMRKLLTPKCVLIFLAIASPWYIAQISINGWEFFDAFVIKHHFKRYTGVITGQSGPLYYYVAVMLIGFFPWVAFLPNALYKGFKEKGIYLFGVVWFLAIFIFFSLAGTKEPSYILPLFPITAITTGLIINDLMEKKMTKIWLYISAGFLIIVSLIMAVMYFAVPAIISSFLQKELTVGVIFPPPLFFWGAGVSCLIVAMLGIAMIRKQHIFIVGGMAAATIVLLIFIRVYAAPFVNIYMQKTIYKYSTYAGKNLGTEGTLATYEINQPSIAFYSRKKFLKLEGEGGLKELALLGSSDKGALVITKKKYIDKLQERNSWMLIATDGKYAILANKLIPQNGF